MPTDIVIRMVRPGDAEAMAAIYARSVLDSVTSFELDAPDGAEMRRRIAATLPALPWIVAVDRAGELAGYAYAAPYRRRPAYRWSVEVSVYVAQPWMRRGVARRLYGDLIDRLARQGYRTIIAGITLPNPASVAFHEALGFEAAGRICNVGWKMGAWHDVGFWQLRIAGDEPPIEPGPHPAIT
jgi:L-amino acid N-acyltransferase YncA